MQQDPVKMLNDAEALMAQKHQPVEAEKLIVGAKAIYERDGDAQGLGLAYRAYGALLQSGMVAKSEQYYRRQGFLDRSVTFDNRLSKAREFYAQSLQNFGVAATQYLEAGRYDRLTNIYFNRAWSHVGLGETEKACEDLDRSLEAHTQYMHIDPSGQVSLPARFKSVADEVASAKHVAGCPSASSTRIVSLRPAQDFPAAESFYPPEAKDRGQEGRAVLNVCVDATGNLSGEPSVVQSSMVASLDAAAVNVAKAGSGHYLAPTANNVPEAGCGTFVIAFTLAGHGLALPGAYSSLFPTDPGEDLNRLFSTLSLRKATLDEQLEQRLVEWGKSFHQSIPQPKKLMVGDPDSVSFLRRRASALAQMEVEVNGAISDYIAGMDALESVQDVSDQEHRAFHNEWRDTRKLLLERISRLTSSASSLSKAEDEIGDYYESGPKNPTPGQRAEIDSMMERGREALKAYVTALGSLKDPRFDGSESKPLN